MTLITHHAIREAMLARIQSGEWGLGDLIPGEQSLADEYGCARTTVNRALRALAEEGLVVRKRKEGTRICPLPVRQAKLDIPILREQVEATGSVYRHNLMTQKLKAPPSSIRTRLRLPRGEKALFLETVHLADDRPYAFEMRWVNVQAVPNILKAPLDEVSVNEWLVKSVPFSTGDVMFSATNAEADIADAIEAKEGAAIFVVDRTTWLGDQFITTMKLYYKEGYQLYTRL